MRIAAMNHPAPRDIPAGKVLLSEYRDARREDMAVVETKDTRYSTHPAIRSTVRLVWSSPGWECAGSMMRWTNGFYGVLYTASDGATHGRRFLYEDEDKARSLFTEWTAPVTPVTPPQPTAAPAKAELTCRGAMAGQGSRTIGSVRIDDIVVPFVLRRKAGTGEVTPCIRLDGKLSPICGPFRDDAPLSHLVDHVKEFALTDGATLTLKAA